MEVSNYTCEDITKSCVTEKHNMIIVVFIRNIFTTECPKRQGKQREYDVQRMKKLKNKNRRTQYSRNSSNTSLNISLFQTEKFGIHFKSVYNANFAFYEFFRIDKRGNRGNQSFVCLFKVKSGLKNQKVIGDQGFLQNRFIHFQL